MADKKTTDPEQGGGDQGANPGNPNRVRYVIEIVNDQNGYLFCPITKKHMRGGFKMNTLKNKVVDDRFANCPDIPGMQIAFDGVNGRVEIKDPLAEPKNVMTLKAAQAACEAMNWGKPQPTPTRTFTALTDDRKKDWVYWARRWLDAGQAELVGGAVPGMPEIDAMVGKVERNSHNTNPKKERYPELDEVPPYLTPKEAAGVNG